MTQINAAWLSTESAQKVCAMFADAGFQAYFVGGCVRNALLGVPVSDLDISTDARPQTVMDLAKQAGLKAVPTGIDHGTVTVVVDGHPFEITTFRRDVETDGRRAVVAFADTIEEDAHRRDFTMNALYAESSGEVIDPLGGLPDLLARRVRFIDNPHDRIKEDYLRILRFFRFYAWYGDLSKGLDAEGLAACAENLDGIGGLSKERIGHEMRKLLAAPNPAQALSAMGQSGVLLRILAGSNPSNIAPLVHVEEQLGLAPDTVRRLAALGGENVAEALRLSKADMRKLVILRAAMAEGKEPAVLGYKLGAQEALSVYAVNCALLGQEPDSAVVDTINLASKQVFPVTAKDLMPAFQGPELGAQLSKLEANWLNSGFALSKAQLLNSIE